MFYQRGTWICVLRREDYCHHMTVSERDKRKFENIECHLASDVIPGKCSCWYLNPLFLLGNEMQCTQKALWFLSWEAELMPYGLMLTKRTDNVIVRMCRITVFINCQTKTAENIWVLSSLILNKKWNTTNLVCSLQILVFKSHFKNSRLFKFSDFFFFFLFFLTRKNHCPQL